MYPPVDIGILVVDPRELVASQDELVQRLRRHLALPADRFEEGYLAPIHRVASLVGLLPATRAAHHSGQGGLFRLALEAAFGAARAADGVVFGAAIAVDRRRQVEAAWRHAAFLGGLACELHRPLTEMVVVTGDGATWNPYMGALHDWVRTQRTDRVFVRWVDRAIRPQGSQTSALWVMPAVVGPKTMARLHDADPAISQVLAAVCAGVADRIHEHQLARVVRVALEAVRTRDLALQPSLYGNLTQGSHLEPWLLDGMRALLRKGSWRVNEPGAALLFTRDGLFLRWCNSSCSDLHNELSGRGNHGVPVHEATLADLLLHAGVVARSTDNDAFWQVQFLGDEQPVTALKFVRSDVLLSALDEPAEIKPVDAHSHDDPRVDGAPAGPGSSAIAQGQRAPLTIPIVQLPDVSTKPQPAAAGQGSGSPLTGADGDQGVRVASDGDADHPGSTGPAAKGALDGVPATSRKQRRPGSPIVVEARPPAVTTGHELDPELARRMGSPAVAGLVADLVDWWNSGAKRGHFERIADGLAVRLEIVTGSGVSAPEVFKPLRENGWVKMFERAPGRSAPVTEIEFTGGPRPEKTHAFVLTEAFARHAGFVL